MGTTFVDAQHATIRAREQGGKAEVVLPMELGADGWRLVVPETAINGVKKGMNQVSVEASFKN